MKKVKSEKLKVKSNGFTLIELLIVVAIIGVLASLLMANFIGVRQRGRDGQRKSDINQIRSALELYRADNGSYPSDISSPLVGIGATYMKEVPADPQSGNYFYGTVDNSNYCIRACLENDGDAQSDEERGKGNNYACEGVSDCTSGKSFTAESQ